MKRALRREPRASTMTRPSTARVPSRPNAPVPPGDSVALEPARAAARANRARQPAQPPFPHDIAEENAHSAESAESAESADTAEPHEPLGPDDPLAPPFNPYKRNRGITRAWHAMKNSIAGFRVAIREESAFRQELTFAAILVPIGIVVPVEPVARVLLLGSVMLVLIVELINSGIENAIDRIGLERNELSRRAKDLGSAAVMVALLTCAMTWGLILVPLFGPPLARWLTAL
jgi:diacylglycerol kinase (ATP)